MKWELLESHDQQKTKYSFLKNSVFMPSHSLALVWFSTASYISAILGEDGSLSVDVWLSKVLAPPTTHHMTSVFFPANGHSYCKAKVRRQGVNSHCKKIWTICWGKISFWKNHLKFIKIRFSMDYYGKYQGFNFKQLYESIVAKDLNKGNL